DLPFTVTPGMLVEATKVAVPCSMNMVSAGSETFAFCALATDMRRPNDRISIVKSVRMAVWDLARAPQRLKHGALPSSPCRALASRVGLSRFIQRRSGRILTPQQIKAYQFR